jgi:CRP-like cAMP-binding protein
MEQKEISRTAKPPAQNRLLAALPRKVYGRLAQHLEPVTLAFGEVLHESGSRIRHAYFPLDGLISLLTVVGKAKATEIGIVGNEGVVGASAALGIDTAQQRAVVQGAGTALRIASARLQSECSAHENWYRELFRFTNALMHQAAQTAACNRFHAVEPRLARWLLATRDRVHSNYFQITHEFLSQMLGVRRVGVTEAAASLQKRKLISYSRGNIQLLDPAGLEASACECYGAVRAMYRRSYKG